MIAPSVSLCLALSLYFTRTHAHTHTEMKVGRSVVDTSRDLKAGPFVLPDGLAIKVGHPTHITPVCTEVSLSLPQPPPSHLPLGVSLSFYVSLSFSTLRVCVSLNALGILLSPHLCALISLSLSLSLSLSHTHTHTLSLSPSLPLSLSLSSDSLSLSLVFLSLSSVCQPTTYSLQY